MKPYLTLSEEEIRKEQNIIINKRIGILVFVTILMWSILMSVIYVRPAYWDYYTQIQASPFIVTKPNNNTIFAAPCIFEITEPYYNIFSCNERNIVYSNKILTCPDEYYCSDLNDRKVCMLNSTYYCPHSTSEACVNDVADKLGIKLFSVEILKTDDNEYVLVTVITTFYSVVLIISIIAAYLINWGLYIRDYDLKRFHALWYVCISVIYYVNILIISLITCALLPNVNGYRQCYDMNLIMLSRNSSEICFLIFVMTAGCGTIIYLAVLLSMARYLRQENDTESFTKLNKKIFSEKQRNKEQFDEEQTKILEIKQTIETYS